MSQHYTDEKRASDKWSLPDVETFYVGKARNWRDPIDCPACGNWSSDEQTPHGEHVGWWYAFGFPGCLYDSDPIGPFATEAEALADAQSDCEED